MDAREELGKISSVYKDHVKDSLPPGKWYQMSYEEKLAAVKSCFENGKFTNPPPHPDMPKPGKVDERDPDRCDYAGGGGWYGRR